MGYVFRDLFMGWGVRPRGERPYHPHAIAKLRSGSLLSRIMGLGKSTIHTVMIHQIGTDR